MNLGEFAGALVGFVLTLMVFSYLIGDNFLFRLAVHIFVGVAAGYALVVVTYNVFWYQLLVPILVAPSASQIITIWIPMALGIWLLMRTSTLLSPYTTPVLAFLAGIGAAAAIGGAVFGTLFPQIGAFINTLNLAGSANQTGGLLFWFFNGLVILAGTVFTLVHFNFSTRVRAGAQPYLQNILETAGLIGQGFVAIALGVLFAGVYAAALAAFVERWFFLWDFFWSLFSRFFSG